MIPHSWYEFFALVAASATSYYPATSRAQARPNQEEEESKMTITTDFADFGSPEYREMRTSAASTDFGSPEYREMRRILPYREMRRILPYGWKDTRAEVRTSAASADSCGARGPQEWALEEIGSPEYREMRRIKDACESARAEVRASAASVLADFGSPEYREMRRILPYREMRRILPYGWKDTA